MVEPPHPSTPVVAADARGVVGRVADTLLAGGCVVLPTDTVYGLAALPASAGAVERVFALKGRPAEVPLAVLCADPDQALALAHHSPAVRRAADRLWPGPLTLVLDRRRGLGLHLGDPPDTIGLRCPDHALLRAVASVTGPVATTSANRHGEPTAADLAGVLASMTGPVDLAVDGGTLAAAASTVARAGADGSWRILREGPVSLADLEAAARP